MKNSFTTKILNILKEATSAEWRARLEALINELYHKYPFYYSFIKQLTVRFHSIEEGQSSPPSQRTMYVQPDKKILGIFQEYMEKINNNVHLLGVLIHEAQHILWNHGGRGYEKGVYRSKTRAVIWNIACDYFINWRIKCDNIPMPADGMNCDDDGTIQIPENIFTVPPEIKLNIKNYSIEEDLYEDLITYFKNKATVNKVKPPAVGDVVYNTDTKEYGIVVEITTIGDYRCKKVSLSDAIEIARDNGRFVGTK